VHAYVDVILNVKIKFLVEVDTSDNGLEVEFEVVPDLYQIKPCGHVPLKSARGILASELVSSDKAFLFRA
jgi:hypothetical protein